jgi:hypothetical protein
MRSDSGSAFVPSDRMDHKKGAVGKFLLSTIRFRHSEHTSSPAQQTCGSASPDALSDDAFFRAVGGPPGYRLQQRVFRGLVAGSVLSLFLL